MGDLIYVGIIIAFFGVAAAFVMACDYIIGPDPTADESGAAEPEADPEPVGSRA